MTEHDTRTVMDRAREPWTVEVAFSIPVGGTILRYRHDMGYELTAMAPSALHELTDRQLVMILEDARRRAPRSAVANAA